MNVGERPQQCFLNKIVGTVHVTGQRNTEGAQAGDCR
jgi:hypothetical protein